MHTVPHIFNNCPMNMYVNATNSVSRDEKMICMVIAIVISSTITYLITGNYNIAFVNSECSLAESRVDITVCYHVFT